MSLERDYYGWYECCIHCGYMCDLKRIVDLTRQQYCGVKGRAKKVRSLDKGK